MALHSKLVLKRKSYKIIHSVLRDTVSCLIDKIDQNPVPDKSLEIRLFMVVRNESLRLSFMLEYYFGRGVDRIFVVDNNSTDNIASIVLSKENAHLFHTKDNYVRQGYWVDLLLHRYGLGHWCIIVDADEMFAYPYWEKINIRQLCTFLDKESYDALDCFVLDMYPNKPINSISYKEGSNPLLIAPWFDIASYDTVLGESRRSPFFCDEFNVMYIGPARVFGGMRKRIFGINACLSKFSLIKFKKSMFLSSGAHFIEGANIANIRGALLHFKFLNDFPARVREEVGRGQHWRNAFEYKKYLQVLNCNPNLNLHCSMSAKFVDSNRLVSLGIMKSSARLKAFIKLCDSGQYGTLATK